jgi:hypothetical protein
LGGIIQAGNGFMEATITSARKSTCWKARVPEGFQSGIEGEIRSDSRARSDRNPHRYEIVEIPAIGFETFEPASWPIISNSFSN